MQFVQLIIMKCVHSESNSGIWTHDLLIISLLHIPLDLGSGPIPASISVFTGDETNWQSLNTHDRKLWR